MGPLQQSMDMKSRRTSPEKAKELRVIWKSPLIPSDPLVWRKDLSDGSFFMPGRGPAAAARHDAAGG